MKKHLCKTMDGSAVLALSKLFPKANKQKINKLFNAACIGDCYSHPPSFMITNAILNKLKLKYNFLDLSSRLPMVKSFLGKKKVMMLLIPGNYIFINNEKIETLDGSLSGDLERIKNYPVFCSWSKQ